MKVLLLGDSWATGLGLEQRLLERNHTVFNKAIYGGSNFYTLEKGIDFQKTVKHLFELDLIIFFNTDYCRDLHGYYFNDKYPIKPKTFNEAMDKILEVVMERINTLRNGAKNAKWAVIGGHAGLYKEEDWKFADFLIVNYREELLNKKMPICHTITFYEEYFSKFKFLFDAETINSELDKIQFIIDEFQKRRDVSKDGIHPNLDIELKLIDRILDQVE